MPIFRKTGASTWSSASPWVKTDPTTWTRASRVYSKTGVSTWTEVWPRQPGTPTSLVVASVYRNDRIELDFSWGAASGSGTTTTPVATTSYNIVVYIDGSTVYSTNISGTSFTLTNSGSGYQDSAGQSLSFTVQAVSAAGVLGPLATSDTSTVAQLPPPPQVTGVSQSLVLGDLSYSFSHVGGNRLQGFRVDVYGPTGSANYYYGAATSVSGSGHPWVGYLVNGGNYNVDIYPYGPGGFGPVYSFSGVIPSDVVFSSTRMYTANPGVTVSSLLGVSTLGANSDGYTLYWNQEGGANIFWGNIGDSTRSIALGPETIGSSAGGTRYRWLGVPYNSYGTGRVCGSQFVRRINNPYVVSPNDSQTWIAGYGGWAAPSDSVLQGYDAGAHSLYYGYYFYGNQFRDQLSDAYMGFHLGMYSASIDIVRSPDGASFAVSPILYLHTGGNRSEANNGTWAGGAVLPALGPSVGEYAAVSTDWIRSLIDQASSWKGFGFFANNGATNVYNIRLLSANTAFSVYSAGRVILYHDG